MQLIRLIGEEHVGTGVLRVKDKVVGEYQIDWVGQPPKTINVCVHIAEPYPESVWTFHYTVTGVNADGEPAIWHCYRPTTHANVFMHENLLKVQG